MSTASTIKMDMPSSYSEIPELSVRVHQGRKRLDFAWGTGSYLYLADIHRAPISQSPGTADVAVGSGDLSQASGSASGAAGGEGGGGGGKGGGVYKLTWTPLDARDRRLAYETFPHYSNLQYKKRETAVEGTDEDVPIEWWESVLQYSRNICAVLESQSKENEGAVAFRMDEGGKSQRLVGDLLRKAVWELVEVFYVTKSSNSMVGERLAEWLKNSIDILVPGEVSAQAKLEAIQTSLKEEWQRLPEDNPEYWTSIASAVAVGWLPEAIELLRLHSSYDEGHYLDKEEENGVVEAAAVLLSKMPRMSPALDVVQPASGFTSLPEFIKARQKWLTQVEKLETVQFWEMCGAATQRGLRKVLSVVLGKAWALEEATSHWIELLVAELLHLYPTHKALDGLKDKAVKCMKRRPAPSNQEVLDKLLLAIMDLDTEVVLAECSKTFDAWMMVHLSELLVVKGNRTHALLQKERDGLGGISIEEFYRLQYAQVLMCHPGTWQLSALYLAGCPKYGCATLEALLMRQPVTSHTREALKALAISEQYGLEQTSATILRSVGVHCLKHGKRGAGIFWLQQGHDEGRLSAIANELLSNVTTDEIETSETLEEIGLLLDNLGAELPASGALAFLQRYRELKELTQVIQGMKALGNTANAQMRKAGQKAVECIMQLLQPHVVPLRFLITVLLDSVPVLEWPVADEPLFNVQQINTMLICLQNLLVSHRREEYLGSVDDASLNRLRLALAQHLGRAFLWDRDFHSMDR